MEPIDHNLVGTVAVYLSSFAVFFLWLVHAITEKEKREKRETEKREIALRIEEHEEFVRYSAFLDKMEERRDKRRQNQARLAKQAALKRELLARKKAREEKRETRILMRQHGKWEE